MIATIKQSLENRVNQMMQEKMELKKENDSMKDLLKQKESNDKLLQTT